MFKKKLPSNKCQEVPYPESPLPTTILHTSKRRAQTEPITSPDVQAPSSRAPSPHYSGAKKKTIGMLHLTKRTSTWRLCNRQILTRIEQPSHELTLLLSQYSTCSPASFFSDQLSYRPNSRMKQHATHVPSPTWVARKTHLLKIGRFSLFVEMWRVCPMLPSVPWATKRALVGG